MENKNTYYTEKEIKYYSQIGLSAWRMYSEWLEQYQKEKEQVLIDKIGRLQA